MQGVPDRLAGWEEEFVIPKQYSGSVMAALTTGRITSNVRAQIAQDIATKMLSYCKYPSPEQCRVLLCITYSSITALMDKGSQKSI